MAPAIITNRTQNGVPPRVVHVSVLFQLSRFVAPSLGYLVCPSRAGFHASPTHVWVYYTFTHDQQHTNGHVVTNQACSGGGHAPISEPYTTKEIVAYSNASSLKLQFLDVGHPEYISLAEQFMSMWQPVGVVVGGVEVVDIIKIEVGSFPVFHTLRGEAQERTTAAFLFKEHCGWLDCLLSL